MPEIFLHIGIAKTGTTSLQSFLSSNPKLLRKHGFFYPKSPGQKNHTDLANFAQDDDKLDDELRKLEGITDKNSLDQFRSSFESRFIREVTKAKSKKIVLSNEHCWNKLNSSSEIARLHRLLRQISNNIKVVVYLRRQDDLLVSAFSTAIKAGRTKKFGIPDPHTGRNQYNFYKLLDLWGNVLGDDNIVVKRFDRNTLTQGNIVADFLDTIGLKPPYDSLPYVEDNPRLDWMTLEFLRQFNQLVPPFVDNKINPQRGRIVSLLQRSSQGEPFDISFDDRMAFYQHFVESNRMVAKRFLREDGDLFSEPDAALYLKSDAGRELSTAQTIEIAARLWAQSQVESQNLTHQIGQKIRRLLGRKS